ncbi:hypothetical protein L917_16390, partial [Phytophthora nicotianae]
MAVPITGCNYIIPRSIIETAGDFQCGKVSPFDPNEPDPSKHHYQMVGAHNPSIHRSFAW